MIVDGQNGSIETVNSKEICQGPSYTGEIFDEPPVEAGMTQETPDSLDICRGWQLLDDIDFRPIHFYPSFRHSMSEDYPFSDHEVTLFPVKD